ncbi:MAG: ribonuclease P protein component [Hydrogenophaga sp.]|uniref:ribonuclease P protein component n=1 Tax=Hydrogenophaga sp. TaxID=1904254 RepID=UPI00272F1E04|nr:ribonuclease P protein component [Hydrogenophaga sp.]MDP2166613.1 ribonuclease P protein component [Hydrogenophaga sp.]
MSLRYRFPRTHRLLRPAEFKTVFDSTAIKVGEQHFLLLTRPNGLDHARLGLVIAKKKVRLSVDRNQIKRHVRDSFRLNQHELPAVDMIFMARQELATVPAEVLRQALKNAWRRLQRKAASTPDSGSAQTSP